MVPGENEGTEKDERANLQLSWWEATRLPETKELSGDTSLFFRDIGANSKESFELKVTVSRVGTGWDKGLLFPNKPGGYTSPLQIREEIMLSFSRALKRESK